MLISDPDLLGAPCLHRKDAGPDQVAARELEQGRVACPGDDGIVEAPCLIAGQQFRGRFRGGPPEGEPAEHRVPGDWKDDFRLHARGGGIGDQEIQGGGGDLFHNPHRGGDLQKRHRTWCRGEDGGPDLRQHQVGGEGAVHRGSGLGREAGGGPGQESGEQGQKERDAWRHEHDPIARFRARV
jgi:hypothetical protein